MKRTVLASLDPLLALRQEAQADLDAEHQRQLTEPIPPGGSDELAQTLGALVRQLDRAINELRNAARTYGQLERVRSQA